MHTSVGQVRLEVKQRSYAEPLEGIVAKAGHKSKSIFGMATELLLLEMNFW